MTQTHKIDDTIYLVGEKTISTSPFVPYSSILCEFLNDLSAALRSSSEAAEYPDILAFAFWCRRGNIKKLRASFVGDEARLGRGLVFHITPSNVPVNFAYSFVFGLLAGNANIVRVPSKQFVQIDIICKIINRLFYEVKYSDIKAMNAFVKYEQNDKITGAFSASCDARIIWGGDVAIKNIRTLPMPEHGIEIVFADRYSFCVIDAPSIITLDETSLKQLAGNFFNDTYLMDQNACSSPHLIVWLGKEKEAAKEKFWSAVYQTVSEKYNLSFINVVDKYTMLCHNAINLNNIKNFKRHSNYVYRITLDKLTNKTCDLRGKCGYFYEYDTDDLIHISHIINSKFQTLTYFGVDKSKLIDFVIQNNLSGIDRIVSVGMALDIGVIWDGYDIIRSLSRVIDVR